MTRRVGYVGIRNQHYTHLAPGVSKALGCCQATWRKHIEAMKNGSVSMRYVSMNYLHIARQICYFPLKQFEAADTCPGTGAMECIEFERRRGYRHLHGNRNTSALNSMSNRRKDIINTPLDASVNSSKATKAFE